MFNKNILMIFLAMIFPWTGKVPLYQGIGDFTMPISSQSVEAKKYFNQGMVFNYGYNYPEAVRSFLEAARHDPQCAMCYWGAALSSGSCIEEMGDKWCIKSYDFLTKALEHIDKASEKEKDLIYALKTHIQKEGEEYQISNKRYLQALSALQKKYPQDPDIAAIYANFYIQNSKMSQALVNGVPTGQAQEVIALLEQQLSVFPFHPGLNHFYIHGMENIGLPKKALGAAERLEDLVPISGHLQHMPAHIYTDFGRYHDATSANLKGIEADHQLFAEGGIQDPDFAGFYLHNYYYLFHTLTLEGRTQEALFAAQQVYQLLKDDKLPSNVYVLSVYQSIPFLLMARYGMWDQIKQTYLPQGGYLFTQAAWLYAQGLADLGKQNILSAENQLTKLVAVKKEYQQKKGTADFSMNLLKLIEIFRLDLEGSIAAAHGDFKRQIVCLKKVLPIEKSMYIMMQPWYLPIQLALGDAYLKKGDLELAKELFLAHLEHRPDNGWALYGLVEVLKKQHRYEEAVEKEKELKKSWKYSDIVLKGARF